MKLLISVIIIMSCLIGCDSLRDPCAKRMKQSIKEMGQPDSITKYHANNYNSESWWWYDRGLNYTWRWGTSLNGCEKDTFSFEPSLKPTVIVFRSRELFNSDCVLCR